MVNVREIQKILEEGIKTGVFLADIDPEMVIATIFGTKNYIINTPHVSSQLLGYDIRDEKYLEEEVKPRVRTYMKRLLKAYLMNDNDYTK
jgi:hypothetical protein